LGGFQLIIIGAFVSTFGWMDAERRYSIQSVRNVGIPILLIFVVIEGLILLALPGDMIIEGQFVVDHSMMKLFGLVVYSIGLLGILTISLLQDKTQRKLKRISIQILLFFLLLAPMGLVR
jgi:hypothetical protein